MEIPKFNCKLVNVFKLVVSVIFLFVNYHFIEGQQNKNFINDSITEQKIDSIFKKVLDENRFVFQLDTSLFYNLPIGVIAGKTEDPTYALLIDEVILYSDKAIFNASMLLTNPINNEKLAFMARDVEFSFKNGLTGVIRLELVNEKSINICKDINLQILKGSYVECDCKGFKSLHLKGNFELSENTFIRADNNGNTLNGKVSSFFEVTANSLNDLIFSITIDPFQLKKYPDFTFVCKNLSIDFSDIKNPSILRFPQGYINELGAGMINLWRGVYIQEATILINRKKFKKKNSNLPLMFSANDLVIDETGFSGNFFANNLMTLEEGEISGWDFAIDEIGLQFIQGDLTAGGLKGRIKIPALKNNVFTYSAFIDIVGNYFFSIGTATDLNFDLFGQGKLKILPSSYIKIINDTTGFHGIACFNGALEIIAPIVNNVNTDTSRTAKLKLKGFEFQNLIFSTREPYIDIGYLAYHGNEQGSLSNFPITINDINFIKSEVDVRLAIKASINLKETENEGFSGTTTIALCARKEEKVYKYAGIQINAVAIEFSKPNAYKISGMVAFARGDSVYGDGFRGEINATFSNFSMAAYALFGNVKGTRYFFVDALVSMKPGIQAGVITIFGFGGGLFYHMKQQTGEIDVNSFGASRSGIVYKPDNTVLIGLRASVVLGIVKDEVAKAEATFEISFTNHGGISNIGFNGIAEFITTPVIINGDKVKALTHGMVSGGSNNNLRGAISGRLVMNLDFQNNVFHANLDIFVNVSGLITGVGNNNRAGWAVVHCDPEKWYIKIGTPYDPIGIKLMNFFQLKAYFMAGHDLPTTFPVNPKVAQILGISINDVINAREKEIEKIESGKGIAFGANFDLSTGDLTFLIFYGSFNLGAGFDINMLNYGENAYCDGHSAPLGINGWYAKGQAYAYIAGNIGLTAKVFGKRKKFEILSIGAATWMLAEGPNTFWMKGTVGGYYSILGGMIKGNCKFEIEVGERCQIKGARRERPLGDVQLIADITPKDNSENIDVFITPQIVFNVPVEMTQKISNDDGITQYFRIKLAKVLLKKNESTVNIYYQWNDSKTVLQIIPYDPLWANTKYNVEVEITFEEYINGQWKPFMDEGKVLSESRAVSFTTGLPDKISNNEVIYTYPINRQYNYMPYEYKYAYLITRRNIEGFFVKSEKYIHKARWSTTGSEVFTDINYNGSEKTLYINVPENLRKNSIYHLEILLIPTETASGIDKNIFQNVTKIADDTSGTITEITTRSATGTITTSNAKVLYDWYFKTSNYKNFNERINTLTKNVRAFYDMGYMEFYLITEVPGQEMFDRFERIGTNTFRPLIQIEADLSSTPWFNEYVYPLTYENYPWFGVHSITWRDTTKYGLKAKRAISIWQPSSFEELIDLEISTGIPLAYYDFCDIAYMLPYYWDEDYMQIRDFLGQKVGEDSSLYQGNAKIKVIIDNIKLRPVKPGNYPVIFRYVLPGKNVVTTEKRLTIVNTIATHASDF